MRILHRIYGLYCFIRLNFLLFSSFECIHRNVLDVDTVQQFSSKQMKALHSHHYSSILFVSIMNVYVQAAFRLSYSIHTHALSLLLPSLGVECKYKWIR